MRENSGFIRRVATRVSDFIRRANQAPVEKEPAALTRLRPTEGPGRAVRTLERATGPIERRLKAPPVKTSWRGRWYAIPLPAMIATNTGRWAFGLVLAHDAKRHRCLVKMPRRFGGEVALRRESQVRLSSGVRPLMAA